jgi:hypothetical protein
MMISLSNSLRANISLWMEHVQKKAEQDDKVGSLQNVFKLAMMLRVDSKHIDIIGRAKMQEKEFPKLEN